MTMKNPDAVEELHRRLRRTHVLDVGNGEKILIEHDEESTKVRLADSWGRIRTDLFLTAEQRRLVSAALVPYEEPPAGGRGAFIDTPDTLNALEIAEGGPNIAAVVTVCEYDKLGQEIRRTPVQLNAKSLARLITEGVEILRGLAT